MESILALLVEKLIELGVDYTVKWYVRRITDFFGKFCIEFGIDIDGDGLIGDDEIVAVIHQIIPDIKDGVTLCNDGDSVGIGVPLIEPVDSVLIDFDNGKIISGDNDGILIDYDGDGETDVLIPLPFDFTGDGVNDWGLIVDEDDNGLPDADTELPFYPVGSPEYIDYMENQNESNSSIIMVSADGSMSIYDMDGTLTKEDCDTAYSLWVSENNILDKPLDNYSVSEGILFLILLIMSGYFILHLFKRKDVYR